MTFPPVPRVDLSDLSLGTRLGSGGHGRVVTVSDFEINGEWPAALKLYSQAVVHEVSVGVLEKIGCWLW